MKKNKDRDKREIKMRQGIKKKWKRDKNNEKKTNKNKKNKK